MDELPVVSLWRPDAVEPRVLSADSQGRVLSHTSAGQAQHGLHLPGLVNLHSHAFQRAMAGAAERRLHPSDSFWTWRETMYALAERFDPDRLQAVAAQLYAEMLEAGFTRVCEFHYLHHAPDGRPYADPASMSLALIEAARETGIGLTLLPVLYMQGGFDGRALGPRQRRFGLDVERWLQLFERLRGENLLGLVVGCALHSLRAVPPEAMAELLAQLPADCPIHVHIAEQVGEVQECLAVRGQRPVAWLLANAPVDARWTLVHATHLDAYERRALAASGAVAGLCPTTEANLGDGLFPLPEFLAEGGRIGIGSDSHVSVSLVEELRWLEYGQRLQRRQRTLAADEAQPGVAARLLQACLASGARSGGRSSQLAGHAQPLQPGADLDLLELDAAHPAFAGADPAHWPERWVFASNRPAVARVWARGQLCVEGGRHRQADALQSRFVRAMQQLHA
ncbi:MAG: formimidoylglutamate deiminase [Aquimonas sp.]|nr:formimidoylglutamate deiminase [Aquimonas sp.]